MKASIYVVCAMAGCFKRESSVNPAVWESLIEPDDTFFHVYNYDGIGGYGFGQFTNVPIGSTVSWRCRDYYLWCENNQKNTWDGNAQLEYIIEVEKVWMNNPQKRGDYTTIEEFLESDSTSLEDLVWDFLACWEGVAGDAYDERLEAAQKFYDYIIEHQNDDPDDYEWIYGNRILSWDEMYNNVMCMYFYLEGYAPPTPKKRKGMPVWMMLRKYC